jgi:hypothetical protein
MTIPEVREELLKIAAAMSEYPYTKPFAAKLYELEAELYRRRGVLPTKVRSQRVTLDLKRQIRAYKQAHPSLSEQQIAAHFKVNMGRVSEALIGKRR